MSLSRQFVTCTSAIALFGFAAVAMLVRGEPGEEPEPAQVGPLIKQLGDDDFERREAAGHELHELGMKALRSVQSATKSDDPEIRWRARQLVRMILFKSKATGLDLVMIESGEFKMGSSEAEPDRRGDEPQHAVKITRPFLLGKFEVTQSEYEKVMKTNPSWFTKGAGGAGKVAGEDTSRFPVERVSWFDAIEFCNKLSELDGFAPYYRIAGETRDGTSIKSATVTVAGGKGYRLPTEAEWESACRAGTKGAFFFGTQNTGREANVKPATVPGGYGGPTPKFRDFTRTTPVGFFPPNAFGIYDMHGNVAEWCWDWYDKTYYGTSPVEDPQGPATGNQRVMRGGSWLDLEGGCRSASRFWQTPDERKEYAGFRIARTP